MGGSGREFDPEFKNRGKYIIEEDFKKLVGSKKEKVEWHERSLYDQKKSSQDRATSININGTEYPSMKSAADVLGIGAKTLKKKWEDLQKSSFSEKEYKIQTWITVVIKKIKDQ